MMTPDQVQLCLSFMRAPNEEIPSLLERQNVFSDANEEMHFPPILFLLALIKCAKPFHFAEKLKLFSEDIQISLPFQDDNDEHEKEEIRHKIETHIIPTLSTADIESLIELLSKRLRPLETLNQKNKLLSFWVECADLCLQYLLTSSKLSPLSVPYVKELLNHIPLLGAQEGRTLQEGRRIRGGSFINTLPPIKEEEEDCPQTAAAAAATDSVVPLRSSRSSTPGYRQRLVQSGSTLQSREFRLSTISKTPAPVALRDVKSDESNHKPKPPSV